MIKEENKKHVNHIPWAGLTAPRAMTLSPNHG